MAESAQVRSIEDIDTFRAHLVVFHAKARGVVDEIGADLRRTQLWLETDRFLHWQREVTRRTRVLEAAQQALLSARIATFRDATPVEQNAVHAARRSLEDAVEHVRVLKRWIREFGPRTEILARQIGNLDTLLAQDVPRAIAWLGETVRLLEDYAAPPGFLRSPAESPPTEPTESTAPAPESAASEPLGPHPMDDAPKGGQS